MPQRFTNPRHHAGVLAAAWLCAAGCSTSHVTAPRAVTPDELVYTIVATDDALIAGVTTGVSRSVDRGADWTLARTVAFTKIVPVGDALFAALDDGLAISHDKGVSWDRVWLASGGGTTQLAFDGANLLALGFGGFYRSSDLGAHWEPVDAGLASLPWDITGGPGLFVINDREGIFRSIDGGKTWTSGGAIPGGGPNVFSLAEAGGHFFASTMNQGSGVYVSTDGALTWSRTADPSPGATVDQLLDCGADVFAQTNAGLFRSSDAGATWTRQPIGRTAAFDVERSGTSLYVATERFGVERSDDDGRTWVRVNATGGGPPPDLDLPVGHALPAR